MNSDDFEFGLDSPAYVSLDASGEQIDGAQVVRNTVEEAVLADEVGIDSYNLSEHYRADFMDSAGAVMLAAMASRTKRIRLGTAVTVLSTQDPVRVFTEFSTLDAVSDGRAQIIVGRGSLTDSFPLFGFDLADYETLFEEKLDLFTRLVRKQPVTWSGTVRSSLKDQYVMPPLPAGHLPTWVGVGGSPQSVIRAAKYGLPVIFAVIGGHPSRFAPYIELYRRALGEFGHGPLPVGIHSHGYIGRTDQEARDIQYPHWADMFAASKERGNLRPTRGHFETEIGGGSLYVGSPETVATKLAATIQLLGIKRFDLAYALGRVPHEQRMATIELYGREVIPRVRKLLESSSKEPARSGAAFGVKA